MSVIRQSTALPFQKTHDAAPSMTQPGWHGLVAMTPPQSSLQQVSRMAKTALRPIVRPVRRIVGSLLGQQTSRQLEALRIGQEDLTIAMRALMNAWTTELHPTNVAGVRTRKLVWISSWQTRCGIAEYSREMIDALQRSEAGWQITVLHDDRRVMPQISSPQGVAARAGFTLDGANTVARLTLGIAAEAADCVVIQHHAAILPWAELADLLLHPALATRRVVVVVHNTQEILLLPLWLRNRLHLALYGVDQVVVHSPHDLELLYALGLNNLRRIAQGCVPVASVPSVRDLPVGSAPLIGCTGFLLPHKGARALIAAAANLRDVWPDLRLRLVMARHGSRKSDAEFHACNALARKLQFEAHIEWHTEFLPPGHAAALLGPCDLLVLPYGKTLESSSAAARFAVASGAPTLVTEQPIFDDLGDAVGRLNEVVPGGLAGQIEEWLLSPRRRLRLQHRAVAWSEAHSWAQIGREWAEVLDSLVPIA